ncbi:hypothetical protein B0H11DRAFT_1950477 [Mycena galericulata]|nr:hypothetical protein B0H11DRAFT_1950477 [Mycena galericulata]
MGQRDKGKRETHTHRALTTHCSSAAQAEHWGGVAGHWMQLAGAEDDGALEVVVPVTPTDVFVSGTEGEEAGENSLDATHWAVAHAVQDRAVTAHWASAGQGGHWGVAGQVMHWRAMSCAGASEASAVVAARAATANKSRSRAGGCIVGGEKEV